MARPAEIDGGDILLARNAGAPASVLLGYQSRVNDRIKHAANASASSLPLLLVVEKSRRIGITWGIALPAALTAMASKKAGGQNVYYMGYNLEMARDFIETCAHWLKALNVLAVAIEETIFSDDEGDKDIKAFRIDLPSGHSIVALPSAPRVLRGKQGLVFVDEAAFHDKLDELLKAAIALTFWGKGQVVLISTHNGDGNAFNTLIEEIRAGKRKGEVMRITLKDALADGLFRRICEVNRTTWSRAAEDEWESDLRDTYGEASAEELDVIPAHGAGAVLPRALVKARMSPDYSVVRIEFGGDFLHLPADAQRARLMKEIADRIDPHLAALDGERRHYAAMDFARSVDLSVLPIGFETPQLSLHIPLVIEMRNVPFREQEAIFNHVVERLPRFVAAKMDARGNGQMIAENAQRKFGASRIDAVMASDAWYLENMPPAVARFSDGTTLIPADEFLIDDLVALKRIGGVIKLDQTRTGAAGKRRHGDFAIAFALLNAATEEDLLPVEGYGVGAPRTAFDAFDAARRRAERTRTGWGAIAGRAQPRGY